MGKILDLVKRLLRLGRKADRKAAEGIRKAELEARKAVDAAIDNADKLRRQ